MQQIFKKKYKNNNDIYSNFSENFKSVLDGHVSLNRKQIRGSQGHLMTKQFRESIMNRCKLRSKYPK